MLDPVTLVGDGRNYDRTAVERWLHSRKAQDLPAISPTTRAPISDSTLVPNKELAKAAQAHFKASRGAAQQQQQRRPQQQRRQRPAQQQQQQQQQQAAAPVARTTKKLSATAKAWEPSQ